MKSGKVTAEGDLDFRGTLGVDKEAPVGFAEIRLAFDVDTDAAQDKLDHSSNSPSAIASSTRRSKAVRRLKSGSPGNHKFFLPLAGYQLLPRAEKLRPVMQSISSELLFWYGLALKMASTAVVVVITSIAVERSGPFVGALIAALPTAAGAAYTILAIQHPPSFIAASAIGSMTTSAAVSIYCLAYAALAQRRGLLLCLAVSLLVWFAAAAILRLIDWTPLGALVLNAVVFGITIPLSWRYRATGPMRKFLRTPFDIPLRARSPRLWTVAVVTRREL